jgi:hypothetical protein
MHNPKFDIFVCSRKNPNPCLNLPSEAIMLKLYQQLRRRLDSQGFGNVVVNTMRHISDIELEAGELELLRGNRFYLSEHYLARHLDFGPPDKVIGRYRAPWNTRPSMDAYTYAERGKRPMFHAQVIGGTLTGKTYVLNEFKLLLNELVPGIEIIECDNDIKMSDHWDVASDPEYYKEYGDRIKANAICFGMGPTFNVGIDNELYHNTKI